MDVTINETSLAAFFDELQDMEKEAFIERFFQPKVLAGKLLSAPGKVSKTWGEGAKRFVEQLHPIEGIRKGYRWLSPVTNPERMQALRLDRQARLGRAPTKEIEKIFGASGQTKRVGMTAREAEEAGKLMSLDKIKAMEAAAGQHALPKGVAGPAFAPQAVTSPGLMSRLFGTAGQGHLMDPSVALSEAARGTAGAGRVRSLAEELSRRGWTGGGGVTKYLPMGPKGVIAGFGASSIPGIVRAEKAGPVGPTGEGGTFEKGLGEVGSTAGWIAGTPLGLLGSTGMWQGGEYAGKRVGRVIDRLRGGAGLGTAINAPTPTKAREQLSEISKYYG